MGEALKFDLVVAASRKLTAQLAFGLAAPEEEKKQPVDVLTICPWDRRSMADWPGPYPKLAVGAYYYPWYNKEKWLSPVTLTPTVGRYISADKAVVQRHLFEAAAAGLQFLLCSWDRPESFIDTNVTALFSLLSDGSPLHLAILYESAIALNVSPESIDFAAPAAEGKTIGDVFVEQMCFLAEHYCTRPSYLRIAGRPLIYLYLVRNYHHAITT